jgi:hypothetical protein
MTGRPDVGWQKTKKICINNLTDDKKVGNQYGRYSRPNHYQKQMLKNQVKIDQNNTEI